MRTDNLQSKQGGLRPAEPERLMPGPRTLRLPRPPPRTLRPRTLRPPTIRPPTAPSTPTCATSKSETT
ncbi:hypothetical protein BN903_61 [Halorubrum sp. AJ67]|nr:hypothetical protein BN903_61 [Halorubrum sp. AJ67]